MVASSRVIVVTNSRGIGNGSTTVIDDMLLTRGDTLTSSTSPSSAIRTNSVSEIHHNPRKEPTVSSVNITRRRTQVEKQRTFPSPIHGNNNIRRVRSDNLAQSKRDDPSVRRSIFGHYFKEKPRSYSAPHLEHGQPPPPISNLQRQSPIRSYKRSSSSPSSSSSTGPSSCLPLTSRINGNHLDDNGSHRHQSHDHPSHQMQAVDYRVFAPSEQQISESAICCRYREMNRGHQKDYESVLERQVQVEHSLPPFPSPLIRFCSDTTATVAESDSYSTSRRGNSSCFSSSDGEMHYHGVYSLLTPSSILRPSRYTNRTATIANSIPHNSSASIIDSNNDIAIQTETEELDHHLSAPLSSSFHFPRSYIETSAILKNFSGATTDATSTINIGIEEDEEKNENDNAFITASSTQDIRSRLMANKAMSGLSPINGDDKDCCDNDSQDKTEIPRGLHQNRHLRYDPRVTVTEFEDPVPRKWYNESELEEHKREAILLAQSYLRKHPAVAGWYRLAIHDPITKTYRKRALFSLPVFSSTYVSSDPDPIPNDNSSGEGQIKTSHDQSSMSSSLSQQDKQLTPSVKKILIVHPNPAISSLFCKSMKSMFPSAELVTTGSSKEASRLIKKSFALNNGSSSSSSTETAVFDIIIIEQRLAPQGTSLNEKSNENKLNSFLKKLDKGPLGFLDMLMKKNQEESTTTPVIPSLDCDIRCGSDLIAQVCELMSRKQQEHCSAIFPCLLIGVSVRPERDAEVMRRAGADIVWGIPIPRVGDTLRNKLFTKLLAKRS